MTHTAEYDTYITSSEWEAKARIVREFFHYRCAVCGNDWKKRKNVSLQVHHLTYERLGHEQMTDFRCLCATHHLKGHYPLFAIRRDRLRYLLIHKLLLRWLNPFAWAWWFVKNCWLIALGKLD